MTQRDDKNIREDSHLLLIVDGYRSLFGQLTINKYSINSKIFKMYEILTESELFYILNKRKYNS